MSMRQILARAMPAMTERNFRLFVYGQFISFAGTWLQTAAEGWLVYKLTHSAAWVAAVASLMFVPSMALAPLGGIVVDRFNKRHVLYVTNTLAMLQAFTLGSLTLSGHITLWIIGLLAFILGITTAIDAPARRTLINEIVSSKEHIGSASALNASLITLGQMIGPALAGILIPVIGSGGTFIVNGLTFLAVIVTLQMMVIVRPIIDNSTKKVLDMLISGIRFAWSDKFVRFRLFLIILLSMFGFSYRSILPAITDEVFHGGPKIFGLLSSSVGCGACAGSILVSFFAKRLPFKSFLITGCFLNGVALYCFGKTTNVPIAAVLLFLTGFGFVLSFVTTRATLQQILKEHHPEMTGRVLGIDYMFFFGGIAIGNIMVGSIAQRYSCTHAVTFCGLILLVTAVMFMSRHEKIQSHD